MRDSEVTTAVVEWVQARLALTCIEAHESGPRPALPYLMLNPTGVAEVRERPQEVAYVVPPLPGDATATPVIETEWRFSLHAYGPDPSDILRPLRSGSHLAQINEPLMPGLVIHEMSTVRNVPEWVNNAWEKRANVDVIVRGLVKDGFVIDVIKEYSFSFQRM